MNNRDERIWAKFHELLSLDLHDGDVKLAKERPAQNVHGSILSHKKVFERAVTAIDEADRACICSCSDCPLHG